MNAIHTLAGRPARWLALAALAALLALAAALALSAAPQPAEAQESNNNMQTGTNVDRTNWRLELSLIDDSDGIVPAGSSVRVKAVIKFEVPQTFSQGDETPLWGSMTAADHGNMGGGFNLQVGSTLRIAGPYEWENAGGRTLRIDPLRVGNPEATDPVYGANCVEDYDNTNGPVLYAANDYVGSTAACSDPYPIATPRSDDDWKSVRYSNHGSMGNGATDYLPDRDNNLGPQGPCSASTTDGTTTWTCELVLIDEQFGWKGNNNLYSTFDTLAQLQAGSVNIWTLTPARQFLNAQDASVTIPRGTPDGAFTISGSVRLHSGIGTTAAQVAANTGVMVLTDSLTVNIGTVAEAASATLDFATQTAASQPTTGAQIGSPWPDTISHRSSAGTQLSLSILNENDKPSARGSVASIVLSTNIGRLESTGSAGECIGGNGNLTCQIAVANLNTSNTGDIRIRVLPPSPARAGVAMVRGTVLNTSGMSHPLGPVAVTFTGDASTLTISEPSSSILNVDTTGNDNRDRLTLSVSATDASDNRATVPGGTPNLTSRRSAVVKDPEGNRVTQASTGISVAWPLAQTDDATAALLDATGNLQARIDVGAAAASALKSGVYTLELTAGSLKDTVEFTVAGEAANIEIEASESEFRITDRFTLTATVTNEDGSAVPDGTLVTWGNPAPTSAPKLVRVSRNVTPTKDGQATATYSVIAEGAAWVTPSSGTTASGFWQGNVGKPADPPEPTNPAESLRQRAGYSSYLGQSATTASALLEGLGNVNAIRIWQLDRWLLYAVIDGVSPRGSEDFTVELGDVLWIGS